MTRAIVLFAAAAVLLGIGAGTLIVMNGTKKDIFADCRRSVVAGGSPQIGGPFELVDGNGVTVSDADVITRPTLVYFGYSFCPDVCPTDLSRNAIAADLLAERGIDVGQVFVTIDPERDTPGVLKDFTGYIHPDLRGLSGSAKAIADAASAYRVFFQKSGDDREYYLMDHSTFTYLMAPAQGFLEFFQSTATAKEVADSVSCFASKL
jgi:protein SCO1/2